MNYERGVHMRCHHNKDVIEWEALVQLPWAPHYTYRWAGGGRVWVRGVWYSFLDDTAPPV
jgi:hypothetical protein